MKWLKRAACLGSSTETFYLEDRPLDALMICSICPVKSECFEYAIKHEEYGVWGGSTEQDRRTYRKTYGISIQTLDRKAPIPDHGSCGTETGYQNLRQYWHKHKDKPRPNCPACTQAHQNSLVYDRGRSPFR